jgi:beta-phosphoglucomutase-like phosphatase (HAD superfamily)
MGNRGPFGLNGPVNATGIQAVIFDMDGVEHKKRAPDIFLAAASKLGRKPTECVVLEDAVNGIEAVKAAGMRCVAVAQTFAADLLAQSDLVRPAIGEVTLADLTG